MPYFFSLKNCHYRPMNQQSLLTAHRKKIVFNAKKNNIIYDVSNNNGFLAYTVSKSLLMMCNKWFLNEDFIIASRISEIYIVWWI